jgi:hypothetical protein
MCCQPGNHSACQLRKPIDVVATKLKMQLRWNHARLAAGPESRKPKRNGSHNEQGLEVKDALSPSGRGRKMSLTFPLIEQALSQLCAFCSPDRRKESANLCYRDFSTAPVLPGACPSCSTWDRQAKSGLVWLNRRRQPYCFFRSGK